MAKEPTFPIAQQLLDKLYFDLLQLCLDHNLIREDFYFLNDKDKEKRVNAVTASEVLLADTDLKNIRICLHTRTSYFYDPSRGIYGPLRDDQVKWLLTRVIEKIEVHDLIQPNYIDQIFKALKNNSKVTVSAAFLLRKG